MIGFLGYTLKASICVIVFYIFFVAVIRNHTFLVMNRLYLLSGLMLSLIIPVLKISLFDVRSSSVISSIMGIISIEQEYDFLQPQHLTYGKTPLNYAWIMPVIYFTGMMVLFFKLLISISRTFRIISNSETHLHGNIKIVKTETALLFTFFNMILLPKGDHDPLIMEHEMAHIRQKHWFDLILMELVSLLLWFNPFVVLYKNSLKLQHEYLADLKVIKTGNPVENYLSCMIKQVQVEGFSGLVHPFYCKTIKKRIIMITKNRTSAKSLGLYLLILPLIGLLLLAFTGSHIKTGLQTVIQVAAAEDAYVPSICPLDVSKVTRISGYGERLNPLTGKKDFHKAVDFAAGDGENIMSTAKGVVTEAEFSDKGMGYYILIRHNDTYTTFYSHLKSFTVKAGDPVEKGQLIGYVGNTGLSKGPHLHYEVIKDGERVNPEGYLPKNK
jgi:hypothetical protein